MRDRRDVVHGLVSELRLGEESLVQGYVFSPAQLWRRFTVELLLDGFVVATRRADEFVDRLWRERRGDGCYGFSVEFGPVALPAVLELRLANELGTLARLELTAESASAPAEYLPGEVRWSGGLRLTGYVLEESDGDAISCTIDGALIHQGRTNGWGRVRRGAQALAARSFGFHLPGWLADGRSKSVHVFNGSGVELTGSPVALVAFEDPLREVFAERDPVLASDPRIRLYERLFPQAVPFDEWACWAERWLTPAPAGPCELAVVVIGDGGTALQQTLESLEAQEHVTWMAAAVPSGADGCFAGADLADFLSGPAAACEFVVFAVSGARFAAHALERMAAGLAANGAAQLLYPDLYGLYPNGECEVWAFPAFDYERLLAHAYCARLFVARRECLGPLIAKEELSLLRIVLEQAARDRAEGESRILHLPGPAAMVPVDRLRTESDVETGAHLDRVPIAYRDEVNLPSRPERRRLRRRSERADVSVLVTSDGDVRQLEACLKAVHRDRLARGCPILVVTNASEPGLLPQASESITVMACGGSFARHRLLNIGLARSRTDFVCVLDARLVADGDDWLGEMLSPMTQADVCLVGGIGMTKDGCITQAGYVTGPHYAARPRFAGAAADDPGYQGQLALSHEVSAISLRCALVRCETWGVLGPCDEALYPAALRDVDVCLRARALRQRIVVTPGARFFDERPEELDVAALAGHEERQLGLFRQRWRDVLLDDPLYNPILGLDGGAYDSLAWPPRDLSPRFRF